jgi:hypothetical protein
MGRSVCVARRNASAALGRRELGRIALSLAIVVVAIPSGGCAAAIIGVAAVPPLLGAVIGASVADPYVTRTFPLDPDHPDVGAASGQTITVDVTDGRSFEGHVDEDSIENDVLLVKREDGSTVSIPLRRVRSLSTKSGGGSHFGAGLAIGLGVDAVLAIAGVVLLAVGLSNVGVGSPKYGFAK